MEQQHSSKAVCFHHSHFQGIIHPEFPAAVLQPSLLAMLVSGLTSQGSTQKVWLTEVHSFPQAAALRLDTRGREWHKGSSPEGRRGLSLPHFHLLIPALLEHKLHCYPPRSEMSSCTSRRPPAVHTHQRANNLSPTTSSSK